MARRLRIQYEGGLYHVTQRDNERKAIVRDEEIVAGLWRPWAPGAAVSIQLRRLQEALPQDGYLKQQVSEIESHLVNLIFDSAAKPHQMGVFRYLGQKHGLKRNDLRNAYPPNSAQDGGFAAESNIKY